MLLDAHAQSCSTDLILSYGHLFCKIMLHDTHYCNAVTVDRYQCFALTHIPRSPVCDRNSTYCKYSYVAILSTNSFLDV